MYYAKLLLVYVLTLFTLSLALVSIGFSLYLPLEDGFTLRSILSSILFLYIAWSISPLEHLHWHYGAITALKEEYRKDIK